MASSSDNPKAHDAQVATAPDRKTPSRDDLLADKKSGISLARRPHSDSSIADTWEKISNPIEDEKSVAETRKVQPLDNGSEFGTDNQLPDPIEPAWAHPRSLPIACTSDTCSDSQASDAVTEIDDCSQESNQLLLPGTNASYVEAPTLPSSLHVATKQGNGGARIHASMVEISDPAKYEHNVNPIPAWDFEELDEYIFEIRKRSHKQTKELIDCVDINSAALSDIVREVLKNIQTVKLDAGWPGIERDLLYQYLDELRDRLKSSHFQEATSDVAMLHLSKLIQYLEETYAPVIERLNLLRRSQTITWDLIWALLKPGTLVFATCPSTGLPRCLRYDYLEKKTIGGREFLEIHGRYFDYDGEVFGESTETLCIGYFRGTKRIHSLSVYPLNYHKDPSTQSRLVCNGRRFISLIGSHHREYCGHMFILKENRLLKIPVKGRIMVDTVTLRKRNPCYPRLAIKTLNIQDKDIDFSAMKEEDFAICNPTVLGFSLNKNFWGEFNVEDIKDITFSSAIYDMLTVPGDKKKIIRSLVESRVSTRYDASENSDAGKGHGITILLHGPPGVGKTLTAEAISEELQRPLHLISPGDLSTQPAELKAQLSCALQLARDWKAVLLIDGADVYLQNRHSLQLERNYLVAAFQRTLEHHDGIVFLTTDMLEDPDPAILDRIDLKLEYSYLDEPARKSLFRYHLPEGSAGLEEALTRFSKVRLSGRQIKNVVKLAYLMAQSENTKVDASHLQRVLTQSGYSIPTPDAVPVSLWQSLIT